MTRPSPGHLKYLAQRASEAERMYRIAIIQRLGATVIKRRLGTWRIRVAECAAAMPAQGKAA